MRVYIAGPMRGYDEFNFPAFDKMRDRLLQLGVDAISPADLDRRKMAETGKTIDQLTPEECMEEDIHTLSGVDAIVLLDGWVNSRGVGVEVAYARYRGIPVFTAREFHLFHQYLLDNGVKQTV